MKNKSDPKIEPCGTLLTTVSQLEKLSSPEQNRIYIPSKVRSFINHRSFSRSLDHESMYR